MSIRSRRSAIAQTALFLLIASLFSTCYANEAKLKEIQKTLQDLVSMNAAPELRTHDFNALLRLGPTQVPLFAVDFDWADQKRVRAAVASLDKIATSVEWDQLLEHINEERYCITIVKDEYHDPRNYSVGALCDSVARHYLSGPFLDNLGFDDRDRPIRISYKQDDMRDLREWRKNRKQLRLDQLQLEIGERILSAVPAIKFVSEAERDKLSLEIAGKIEMIKRTGLPIMTPFWNESLSIYTSAQAATIRKAMEVKKGSP